MTSFSVSVVAIPAAFFQARDERSPSLVQPLFLSGWSGRHTVRVFLLHLSWWCMS